MDQGGADSRFGFEMIQTSRLVNQQTRDFCLTLGGRPHAQIDLF